MTYFHGSRKKVSLLKKKKKKKNCSKTFKVFGHSQEAWRFAGCNNNKPLGTERVKKQTQTDKQTSGGAHTASLAEVKSTAATAISVAPAAAFDACAVDAASGDPVVTASNHRTIVIMGECQKLHINKRSFCVI